MKRKDFLKKVFLGGAVASLVAKNPEILKSDSKLNESRIVIDATNNKIKFYMSQELKDDLLVWRGELNKLVWKHYPYEL